MPGNIHTYTSTACGSADHAAVVLMLLTEFFRFIGGIPWYKTPIAFYARG